MRPASADRRRAWTSGGLEVATAFAATVLLAACGETAPYACLALAEGVEVVANEGPGAWAEDDLSPRLTELWRRGGTREGEELVFPAFPGASRTGRLAVPDFRLAETTVIEPDGTWAGSWTRSGEGPGEIRSAVAASWTADGDLLVFDVVGSKVVRLEGPSDVVGEIPIERSFTVPVVASGVLIWAGVEPNGDLLLTTEGTPADSGTAQNTVGLAIRELEVGAERPTTVSSTELPAVDVSWTSDWILPARPRPRAATSAHGALVVAATDGSYLGEVRMPEGEALQAALGDTIWTFEVGKLDETWVRARELTLVHGGEAAGSEER